MEFEDIDVNNGDFERIGQAFEAQTGCLRRGQVACASAMLMPQRGLVDFAANRMTAHGRG